MPSIIRVVSLLVLLSGTMLGLHSSALADDIGVGGETEPTHPGINVEGIVEGPETSEGQPVVNGPETGATYELTWLPACFDNYPEQQIEMCAAAQSCDSPNELLWTLWIRQLTDESGAATPGAEWSAQYSECRGEPPPGAQPVVTDVDVLAAVRRLGLPRLTVQVQPPEETLVNFETIFYADEPQWLRTVTLLGYTVDIEAEVASYDWLFGDGTTAATTTPGAPYPAKDIVHEYSDAHVTVQPRVDVAYEIRYRVDGAEWQTIEETVPAQGYATELLIREATPVLVGD